MTTDFFDKEYGRFTPKCPFDGSLCRHKLKRHQEGLHAVECCGKDNETVNFFIPAMLLDGCGLDKELRGRCKRYRDYLRNKQR